MAKPKTIKIKMVSTENNGVFYTDTKNPANCPEKLERTSYDHKVRRHVKFVEKKIK